MSGTFWAVLPPVIAIVLALLTKEVYISLFIGIIAGCLLFTGGNVIFAVNSTFEIMGGKVSENVDILIFLVLLGIIVALISKSGASRAYGNWAVKTIRSKRGSLLATTCLGAVIFVDDYFNCLTVGTVMRPMTDRHNISRAKLAYIIDATAAPVCIIAPISSWAAAVGSSLPKDSTIDGFSLFLQTIPFNFYALFTIVFMLFIIFSGIDFLAMKKVEDSGISKTPSLEFEEFKIVGHGTVLDLILPILALILSCIGFMLYTGGFFQGISLTEAFANCIAARSLVLGSFFTIVFTFFLYLFRKIITFTQFCDSFTEGFKAMAPSILILCLAWTLSGICSPDYLDLQGYVAVLVAKAQSLNSLLPSLFFLVSLGLAFATGTSWGTFGILIPIAAGVFSTAPDMIVISVAAILAGAVCGDHISPISDTTILSSTGAQCNHIEHVNTQIPYALCVAACSLLGFLVAGLTRNGYFGLLIGGIALFSLLAFLFVKFRKAI